MVGVSGYVVPAGSGCCKWAHLEFMGSWLLVAELSIELEGGVGLRGSWRVDHWGTSPSLSLLSWGHLTELVEDRHWVKDELCVEEELWVEDELWVKDELWIDDELWVKDDLWVEAKFCSHKNRAGGWEKPFVCPRYLSSPGCPQKT